ncbi:MAG: dockerin type I repeat-containing protein, partial [Oscillospiraceae bacterium]|nr:dockerin type I repeat-containing protein [Oscillospiraceae bacterium]
VKEGTANILATYNGKTYMKKITVNFTKGSRTIAEPTGDITGDGVITIGDVVAANRAVLGKDSVTDAQVQICDFNQNGYLDATDALTIMKIVVGLI